MKNFVENQCIKTDKPLPMSYEALKAERDALAQRVEMLAQNLGNAIWGEQEALQRVNALAVENAALKVAVDGFNQELYGKGFEVLGWHLNGDTEPLDNWFGENDWNPETPATSAALAAIRTESHIAGVEAAANRIGVISLKYNPGQKHELIKAIGREVIKYATELREAK